MTAIRSATAAVLVCIGAIPALAQTTAPPTAVPGTSLDDASGTLSQKLNNSDGVIAPKGNVDPAMGKPAPSTGKTPVIKPDTKGSGTGGPD